MMRSTPGTTAERARPDWTVLRQRLEQARSRLQESFAVAPERQREILRARSRAIAAPPPAAAKEAMVSVVEFSLAYEQYALELRYVAELALLRHYVPLPGAPDFVLGIVNLRGRILSVVDFKRFFDLPASGLTDLNRLIVLQHDGMEFGLLADAVTGVRTLPESALQPPMPTLTGLRAEFTRGVTNDPVIVLDAERILSDKRLIFAETVSAQSSPIT